MKVLITGGTGFIGKRLRDRLPQGHEYFFLVRQPSEALAEASCMQGDLSNLDAIKAKLFSLKPDITLHLAWGGIPDYSYETSRRNLEEGINLFHWLVKECGCRKIVATGSCWEYGQSFGPCVETDTLERGSYFSWAKKALCDFGMSMAMQEKINFVWLRLFYVYGPGQRERALIPTLVQAIRDQERPQIKTPLDANDFVYVDDVAGALVRASFEDVPSGIYNLGTGAAVPIWHVCALIEEKLQAKVFYAEEFRKLSCRQNVDFWADIEKSFNVLGWRASTSLEQGIIRYVDALEDV